MPEGLERTKYNVDRMVELIGAEKVCLMTDIRQLKGNIPKASRDYSEQAFRGKIIAFAVLVKSGLSKIFGNMLMGFNKSDAPMKLFTNEEKAIAWLKAQRDKANT